MAENSAGPLDGEPYRATEEANGAMEENLSKEVLKQKVIDLEKRLEEYEQNGAGQHIQEVTKRFEKIVEMGDDGIIVFDEGYRIQFAHNVASELTGYSKESLFGMDFRSFLVP